MKRLAEVSAMAAEFTITLGFAARSRHPSFQFADGRSRAANRPGHREGSKRVIFWFEHVIHDYGLFAVAGVIGLECLGLPMPGEALLIAAAIDAGTRHDFDIGAVIAAAICGAVVGQALGYFIGRRFGYRLLIRYGPRFHISESHIKLGQYLFLRHGGKIILVARFVPVLRSVAGILAGADRMPRLAFMLANVAGAIVWACLYGLAAYVLGDQLMGLAQSMAIILGCAVFGLAVAGAIFLRRHQARLLAEAERELPGPLKLP
jgi:membrane protein DedA with SNARE-associated domain